ncbi:MAG: hypothetical protein ACJAT7_001404 [Psychromonas sp.]
MNRHSFLSVIPELFCRESHRNNCRTQRDPQQNTLRMTVNNLRRWYCKYRDSDVVRAGEFCEPLSLHFVSLNLVQGTAMQGGIPM